jgi:hypothetical protein
MPGVSSVGPFPIQGISLETWLVRFDKNGVCSSPDTRAALLAALAAKPDSPILFFSHGWNNDFSDAVSLYQKFLTRFQEVLQSNPLQGPAPIFIGVTWPSIWLPSDSGPQLAGVGAAGVGQRSETDVVTQELLDILTTNTNWERFYQLIHASQLSQSEARELAGLLKPALRTDDAGALEAAASEDKILETLNTLQASQGGAPARDNLDDIGTLGGADDATQPGAAGFLSFLDPRWAVRLASLYIMKDRAGRVGANGVAALLHDIQQSTQAPLHIIGHSFGAKVMLSALAAQAAGGPRAQSLLLLQPAVSHLSFAQTVPGRPGPGGYRMSSIALSIRSSRPTAQTTLHSIRFTILPCCVAATLASSKSRRPKRRPAIRRMPTRRWAATGRAVRANACSIPFPGQARRSTLPAGASSGSTVRVPTGSTPMAASPRHSPPGHYTR